jgi:hypothetical protein
MLLPNLDYAGCLANLSMELRLVPMHEDFIIRDVVDVGNSLGKDLRSVHERSKLGLYITTLLLLWLRLGSALDLLLVATGLFRLLGLSINGVLLIIIND